MRLLCKGVPTAYVTCAGAETEKPSSQKAAWDMHMPMGSPQHQVNTLLGVFYFLDSYPFEGITSVFVVLKHFIDYISGMF